MYVINYYLAEKGSHESFCRCDGTLLCSYKEGSGCRDDELPESGVSAQAS